MHINWALWLLLIFLIACSQENPAWDQATTEPTLEIVIIGPTDDYPEGCHPKEVADLLMSFFTAYNTGDVARLDELFAGSIEWYSDTKDTVFIEGEPKADYYITYQIW